MNLDELEAIIQGAGGGSFTLDYSGQLLEKINRVESSDAYSTLIKQFRSSKEQGDIRGRVLEINFAECFASRGIELVYGAKQGTTGDVDFCWNLSGLSIFIEMKLLGQDKKTKESVNEQLQASGWSSIAISDDTFDVARIQRDIFEKSSIKKFKCPPDKDWINLVAIDVSELLLGTVDMCDCVLAAAGNDVASNYFDASCLRPSVVGVFERKGMEEMSPEQAAWIKQYHPELGGNPHPQNYIHGILFIFREPKERAALSYAIRGAIVWNPSLIRNDIANEITTALHRVIPCV
jgi:hypothetical protein